MFTRGNCFIFFYVTLKSVAELYLCRQRNRFFENVFPIQQNRACSISVVGCAQKLLKFSLLYTNNKNKMKLG